MGYTYKSIVIERREDEHAIDLWVDILIDTVPNIDIDGPFYYKDDQEQYPDTKTYILTHQLDESFKVALGNLSVSNIDINGKPTGNYGDKSYIDMSYITGKSTVPFYQVAVGSYQYFGNTSLISGDILYGTIVCAEDYMLFNLQSTIPTSETNLWCLYAPLYTQDGEIYSLMYPGLRGKESGLNTLYTFMTYKDTLELPGSTLPSTTQYGVALVIRGYYSFPEFTLGEEPMLENTSPLLTVKTPLYLQTVYGSSSLATGKSCRRIECDYYGRDQYFLQPYISPSSATISYPKCSLITINGKDYYISAVWSASGWEGFRRYRVFELGESE